MARLTTDPKDPELTHGVDKERVPQAPVYLVLSEEERAKGFVRPYRDSYQHVGLRPKHPLRDLTDEEKKRWNYGDNDEYVKYEDYPKGESSSLGRLWTQKQLDNKGCGTVTTMGRALSETYSRDPTFYGSTYCCGCGRHIAVEEFIWTADGEVVGS